jgi:hypothetical protein
VFENRVLRVIFGPKREVVVGGWGKLHDEELHKLYTSPNITRVIKARRMRWVGHVACMGRQRKNKELWSENPNGRDHLGDEDVDG